MPVSLPRFAHGAPLSLSPKSITTAEPNQDVLRMFASARTVLVAICSSLMILLSACETVKPLSEAYSEQLWLQQQQKVLGFQSWGLSGRLGLRTASQGGSASLEWNHSERAYDIRIVGPFGQGNLFIEGDDSGVRLSDSRTRQIYFAQDPEQLIYQQFGWQIPVNTLKYWVLGIPDPEQISEYQWDQTGLLTHLKQAGWEIQYKSYRDIGGGFQLPRKIFLSKPGLEVRLAVHQWQLESEKSPEG